MDQSTCNIMWNMLAPAAEYRNRWDAFRDYWHRQSVQRQRQLYWFLNKEKEDGKNINPNPLFAVQNCHPQPTNWNGKDGINKQMKTERMVIAKYGDRYGSYTLFEAWLFEMSDAVAANFRPETLSGKQLNMFNLIKRK